MNDKEAEKHRYDNRAKHAIDNSNFNNANNLTIPLKAPYNLYRNMITNHCGNDSFILEIGAGMGENTEFLLDIGARVCATDISQHSLSVIKSRFESVVNAGRLTTKVADMEMLPFNDGLFDVVVSAGSLSYGDHDTVLNEIHRVLKPDGVFIVIDSLNNNPIYRFNRYIHYLKGDRSKSTLIRMPTMSLIDKYTGKFGHAKVKFFGTITWAFPLLSKVLSEQALTKLSNLIDTRFNIRGSAFKFVMMAVKNEK